jgi:hypothetical protein
MAQLFIAILMGIITTSTSITMGTSIITRMSISIMLIIRMTMVTIAATASGERISQPLSS